MQIPERILYLNDTNSGNVSNKTAKQSTSFYCLENAHEIMRVWGSNAQYGLRPYSIGVSDIRLKERLLHESSELTLEKTASLCRAAEACAKQLKEIHKPNVGPNDPKACLVKPTRGESSFDCIDAELSMHQDHVLPLGSFAVNVKGKTTLLECVKCLRIRL